MIPDIDLSVFVRMGDKITAPLRDVENTVAKASERMTKRLQLSMKLAGGGAIATGIALATRHMVQGFTDSIREVERAKGELATLGVQDLGAIVNRGREMQTQLAGITADAFVRAAYDIKSGISSLTDQGVADMTASALTVAKATKGQAEQMTSLFATSYGIFKKQMADLTDAEFGERFGAALSASVQQFKTDGAAMQQAIESAGAGAVNLGMQMTEQLTLLGMMQQQMQAGEAGTALRAFATNAAKAHEAFGKMKVTTDRPVRVRILDEDGQLRAMPDILADLQARYGETLDAFEAQEIKEAFGTDEAMKMINALYGQEAAVRANAEALGDAASQGDEFTQAMARAADANWDSAMLLMSQKMDVLRQKIGERLLPVVERLVPVFDAFIERAFSWIDANPGLVTGIGAVVVGLGALAAIIAPILLGASALVSTWAMMSYGATRLTLGLLSFNKVTGKAQGLIGRLGRGVMWLGKKVLPIVGRALLAIGRVLMANPLGLAITAIAGAAYLIYEYWEPISGFFSNLWEGVKSAASAAWDWLKSLFMRYTPHGLIISHWESIAGFFSGLWERVKSGVSAGWDRIKSAFLNYTPLGLVFKHWDTISETFSGYWESIKAGVSKGWDAIKALFLTYHPVGMVISNWDSIVETFAGYWTSIKSGISTGWDRIKTAFLDYTPARLIVSNWDGITETFAGYWSTIKSGISTGWDTIKTLFMDYHPIGMLISNWDGIVKTFAGYWTSIKDGISAKWEEIKTKLAEYGPDALIKQAWEGTVEWFGSLWQKIRDKFTSITWADVLPNWDWGFITPFDLKDIITWPDPPNWWKKLMGEEEVEIKAPSITEAEGFAGLAPEQQQAARTVERITSTGPLPTSDHIGELNASADELRNDIAAVQASIDQINPGPMAATLIAPKQVELENLQADLAAAEVEIAATEASAIELGTALQILSETEAKPEINTASVDAALAKVARLSAQLRSLQGGAASAPPTSPVQPRAKGGWYKPGWLLTGEQGPELRYETQGGFIAHNRALRGMMGMASRAREMINGIDMSGLMGGAPGMEPAMIPAMSAIAPMGAERGGSQITFAPVTHMPALNLDRGVDLEEAQNLFETMLNDRDEQIAADQRRLLHDV